MNIIRHDRAVSPVVGIAVLVAITVILSALVFAVTGGFMTEQQAPSAGANINIASESVIEVQLDSIQNADSVYVQSPLGTRYEFEGVGDTVEILNIGNKQKPVVIAEKNGKENVVQGITPRSFDADIVVSKNGKGNYESINDALSNVGEDKVIVVKKNTYNEDITVSQPSRVISEEGTTLEGDVAVSSKDVTVSNFKVTGSTVIEGEKAYFAGNNLMENPTISASNVTVKNDTNNLLLRQNDDTEADESTTTRPDFETVSWSSASDWDNAVNENGVVHEAVDNTGNDDPESIKIGYRIEDPYKSPSLVGYWPLHEVSGTVAYDQSGNSFDGEINNVTLGQTGLTNNPAYSFDGSNDDITLPDLESSLNPPQVTFTGWVKTPDDGNNDGIISGVTSAYDRQGGMYIGGGDGNLAYYDGSSATRGSSLKVADDNWHFVAVSVDGETMRFHRDGQTESVSGGDNWTGDATWMIGQRDAGSWDMNGNLTEIRAYSEPLSKSEVQELYNVINKTSTLTTRTKSFSEQVKPNLDALEYSLNGQSAQIKVVGSPGSQNEEINTVELDGDSNYSIEWSEAHAEYQVQVSLDTVNPTKTPSVSSITLNPTDNLIPTAEFTTSSDTPSTGEIVSFDASNSSDPDGNSLTYSWDFDGDGNTDATGEVVEHAFEERGQYNVTLIVSDGVTESRYNKQIDVSNPSLLEFSDNFSTDEKWVEYGNDVYIDTGNERINVNARRDTTSRVVHKFINPLGDTWSVDFSWYPEGPVYHTPSSWRCGTEIKMSLSTDDTNTFSSDNSIVFHQSAQQGTGDKSIGLQVYESDGSRISKTKEPPYFEQDWSNISIERNGDQFTMQITRDGSVVYEETAEGQITGDINYIKYGQIRTGSGGCDAAEYHGYVDDINVTSGG